MNSIPFGVFLRSTIALYILICLGSVDGLCATGAAAPGQYALTNGVALQTPPSGAQYLNGIKLLGSHSNAVGNSFANSAGICQSMCKNNQNCTSWTWSKPTVAAGYCKLKRGNQRQIKDACCISGYVKKAADTLCEGYARKSVIQQMENLRRECGFQSTYGAATVGRPSGQNSILWDKDYGVHYRWCTTGNRYFTTAVVQKRRDMLAECVRVRVPPLVGLLERQARAKLHRLGLKMDTPMQIESDRPDTEVLHQHPQANTWVPPGFAVRVDISSRKVVPADVPVPNLIGLDQEKAIKLLKSAGLKPGLITKRTVRDKDDEVLSQTPVAKKIVSMGSSVDLVIAKLAMIPVPDLKGLDVDQAKALLEKRSLVFGAVDHEASSQKQDIIIRQTPLFGEKVKAQSVVNVTVSDQMVLVPELGGKTRDNAISLLIQRGLQAGAIQDRFSWQGKEGHVVGQYPVKNERVKAGTKVSFQLAVHNTILLVSAGTLLGLLVVGAAYSFRPRTNPVQSASGASAPVVRVTPHKDVGSSSLASEGKQKTGHEVQFRPVADQGEQQLINDSDSKMSGD